MRLGGIEPSSQEPESYVRSITLQAQTVRTKLVPYYISEKWVETQGIFACFPNGEGKVWLQSKGRSYFVKLTSKRLPEITH